MLRHVPGQSKSCHKWHWFWAYTTYPECKVWTIMADTGADPEDRTTFCCILIKQVRHLHSLCWYSIMSIMSHKYIYLKEWAVICHYDMEVCFRAESIAICPLYNYHQFCCIIKQQRNQFCSLLILTSVHSTTQALHISSFSSCAG